MKSFDGRVALEALGQGWQLRLDFNALAEYEELTGRVALSDIDALSQPGAVPKISMLRALCWAGLRGAHPEVTLEEAGQILSQCPGALTEAIAAAMPTAEETAAAGQGAKGKGQVGPGKRARRPGPARS